MLSGLRLRGIPKHTPPFQASLLPDRRHRSRRGVVLAVVDLFVLSRQVNNLGVCACVRACAGVWAYICLFVCMPVCFGCVLVYVFICLYIYIHIHIRTCKVYIYIHMLTPPPHDRRGEGEGWCPCPSMICQRIGDNHLSQTQFQKFRNFCNFQDGWQFLEISTRACNAPSPNLNLSLNLSLVLSSTLSTTTTVCRV